MKKKSSKNYKLILGNNVFWLAFQEIISRGTGILFTMILVRKMGVELFGVFGFLNTLLMFLYISSDLGLTVWFGRKWNENSRQYRQEIKRINGLKLGVNILGGGSLIIFAVLQHHYFLEITFLVLANAFDSFRSVFLVYLNTQNRFKENVANNLADRTLFSILGILALLFFNQKLLTIFFLMMVTKGLTLVWLLIKFRMINFFSFNFKKSIYYLKNSLPFFSIVLFNSIYSRIDILMLTYLKNLSVVGLYSGAYRIMDITHIIPNLIFSAFYPLLIRMKQQNDNRVRLYYQIIYKYLLTIGLFTTCIIFLFSSSILNLLLGHAYAHANLVLKILSLNVTLIFLTIPQIYYLNAVHEEKFVMKTVMTLSLINVILNFPFIYYWGASGAALTTLFCEILNLLVLCFKSRFFPFSNQSMLIGVSNILAIGAGFMSLYFFHQWYLAAGAMTFCYLFLIFTFKIINLREIKYWS